MLPVENAKNNKPYLTCNDCGLQLFVRGKEGIKRINKLICNNKKDFNSREIIISIDYFDELINKLLDIEAKKPMIGINKDLDLQEKIINKQLKKGVNMDTSRFSTCSISFNDRSSDEAFAAIAAAGHIKVDVHEKIHLSLFPEECDHEALKKTAEKHGLQIAGLATYVGGGFDGRRIAFGFHDWVVENQKRFTSFGFSSRDQEELEEEFRQMKLAINLASYFGARTVRVVPGDDKPESIDKIVPWFKKSADHAADKNVYLAVENHSDGIAGTPELCVELSEKVDSPYFGIIYEPGNLMHDTGTDYKKALLTMLDHITHVHVKDCKPVGDGYEMQHFGKGAIDFPWIHEQLDASGYTGDIATEFELHDMDPVEGVKRFYDDYVGLFQNK